MNNLLGPFGRLRRKTLVRLVLMVFVPLLLSAGGLYLYVTSARYVETEDAYVKADKVTVAAEVSGRVIEVAVHENQAVRSGTLLFRLDAQPYRYALSKAQANLEQVRNEIDALRLKYPQKQAELARAQEDAAYFQREFARLQRLRASRTVSEAALDEARHHLTAARLQATTIQREMQQVLAQLGTDPQMPVTEHPRYLQAKAALDQARLDLQHTAVYATMDGVVGPLNLQPGDYVSTASPVFSLVSHEHYIEANVKETELTHLRVGQPASVAVDAFPDRRWSAEVVSISPATGSEFALLPAQNASGNWVKVVQRVPVRLAFTDPHEESVLRSGMSVTVSVDTGYRPDLLAWLRPRRALAQTR